MTFNLKAYLRRAGTDTLIPVTPYFRPAGSATKHKLREFDFRSPPPLITYLTFQSESPFTLGVYNTTKNWDGTLYYSTDTTTWNEWNGTTALNSVNNRLYLRGTGNTVITGGTSNARRWVLTGTAIECIGNIENLLDWETVALGEHPTMAERCYYNMFNGCTSLTTAPALPATTLANYCYSNMFYNCTSLTTAPALPATTLTNFCYYYMFYGCTSLTTAPALPATTLANYCYQTMFYNCSAFKVSATQTGSYPYAWRIPTSDTGTTATNWNTGMLYGTGGTFTSDPVINTTYYVENPPLPQPPPPAYLTFQSASPFTLGVYNGTKNWNGTLYYSTDTTTWAVWNGTTLSSVGNKLYLRGTGNTVITGSSDTARRWVLTGTDIECVGNIENLLDWETVALGEHPTMAESCYYNMFYVCTALITAPELPATVLETYCYRNMFEGCTSLTTAPALPATTLAGRCYQNMFYGCTSLTTVPQLPATTLADYCYSNMFRGCTSLTTAPELPATTLTTNCYRDMFSGCSAFKVSATQTGSYLNAWRIPTSDTGTTATSWNTGMLYDTGGTFTSDPVINTTYYVENPPV